MQPPHITAWAAKSLAGEPVSVVRVRNLQAVTRAGVDAWGRPGKPQPMLVSAELSFRHQFSQAPAEDRLGADTVNYGTLSKAILRTLENPRPDAEALGLGDVVNQIWLELTGCTVGQNPPAVPEETTAGSPRPLVDLSVLRFMSVTLTLPKASLLGQGVSLTASSVFGLRGPGAGAFVEGYATTLRLIGLRVPTLVGVNANERLAKQVVVADVELDKVNPSSSVYTFIEDRVVKTMEQSSFETLEALGSLLGGNVLGSFRSLLQKSDPSPPEDWQVRITLAKPTAVPFADCPVVELMMRENDSR